MLSEMLSVMRETLGSLIGDFGRMRERPETNPSAGLGLDDLDGDPFETTRRKVTGLFRCFFG